MKLGSLFDGSGGFPLSGFLCGIEPIWASEVEPYPIAVTKSRFPHMKHLGDINKINGAEIEPVDIITFGSPCQDLSVAGKRAGLKHENNGDDETTRSGLFMEAVRIIKEMREKTNGEYPKFAVWENVPGAFSSNKGEDFKVVLEELIKIAAPSAVMPEVPRFGWAYADSYCGDGWSLAYRVLDAQYWGVPQRRRRIYLVADFRGECAREILFEREGVRGCFAKGRTPWEAAPADAERGIGADDRERKNANALSMNWQAAVGAGLCVEEELVNPLACTRTPAVCVPYTLKIRSGCEGGGKGALIQKNKSATLACNNDQYLFQPVAYGVVTKGNGDAFISKERHTSLCSGGGQAGQGYPCAMQPISAEGFDAYNQALTGDKSMTVTGAATDPHHVPCVVLDDQGGSQISVRKDGKAPTLRAEMHGNIPCVMEAGHPCICTIALEGNGQRPSHRGDGYLVTDKSYTLNATEIHGVVYGIDHAITTGGNCTAQGPCVYENVEATLKASGVHGVAYSFDPGASRDVGVLFIEECAKTLTNGTCPGHHDGVVIANEPSSACYSIDEKCANTYVWEDQANTLAARDYKQPQAVCYEEDPKPVYIVRRLTPTECARLQGFADRWGDIDAKKKFTDEEYHFWLDVRNTHAAINGKQTKEYTKAQMLTWYNKLNTDGAEYKMWGNGIALPTALYVMQGIKEASNESYKD